MDIQCFKNRLFEAARAAGFESFELYAPSTESFRVKVFGGEIEEFKNSYSGGAAFRGVYGGRMGYASSERIAEDTVEYLLEQAKANAAVIEDDDNEPLAPGGGTYPAVNTFSPSLREFGTAEKCALAKRIEAAAPEYDSRVVSADVTVLGSFEGEIVIANSRGLDVSHRSNGAFAGLMVRVSQDGGEPKVGFESWAGGCLSGFRPEELAAKAVEKGLAQLGARKASTGIVPVVFNNETAADIFAVFSPVFFAESVQKGFSLLGGKLGQEVASGVLTLRDDGYIDGVVGSRPFDAEGVASVNKAVIEQGVLKTFLHNLKMAEKDGTASTGNASKRGLTGAVATGCGIFTVQPSGTSFGELLAMADAGILITKLDGLHAGVNAVTGDFSLSASGFEIRGGKVAAPVDQMVVSGNFYEMLGSIVCVGSDFRFDTPGGDGVFGAPSVYAGSLSISGV